MARALYYPPADRTTQWFGGAYPGVTIDPDKQVWHSTETGGWPSYKSGATAPQLTYFPRYRKWRQHFRADRSARALRNESGGVETNTDNALQVEIIAYSDEPLAIERGHLPVSKLSRDNLRDLGDFARWAKNEWGVPLDIDSGWVRSNYRNPTRMTFDQWRAFTGHTGHNRVPENTHFDPAALDIWTLIDYAKEGDMLITDITDEAARKIARFVLKSDGIIESPDTATAKTNPFWSAASVLRSTNLRVRGLQAALVEGKTEDWVTKLMAAQAVIHKFAVLALPILQKLSDGVTLTAEEREKVAALVDEVQAADLASQLQITVKPMEE